MSEQYLALYRKYRPNTFDEVVGQKHITTSLINQIKNDQISHAYLFCGTRGTGKTSIARIFAKAINCLSPVNGSPCGKCAVCTALNDVNNIDITEIDAASNNRVDEIRELREKVKYPPVVGRYKVYIIDEVHMLTDSAFNALLKTLEEPPHYVVFILGTTEIQKLPATILSRCLRFDFKLIEQQELEEHIKGIFDKEHIKYEDEAVSLIARLGEGSCRDALSIADMCVAYTNKNVTYNSVVEAVGTTDKTILHNLATMLLTHNPKNLLKEIDVLATSGKNMSQLAKDLAGYFRDIAVVQTCDNYEQILKYPKAHLQDLKELTTYDINKILNILKSLSGLEQEFRYSSNPRALFEITCLGIVADDNITLNNRIDELEKLVKLGVKPNKDDISLGVSNSITITKSVEDVKKDYNTYNADVIFGKLLGMLRENNELKIFTLMDKINSQRMLGTLLELGVSNKDAYECLGKPNNLNVLKTYAKKINENIDIQLVEKYSVESSVNIEELLKKQYGNILKVKN